MVNRPHRWKVRDVEEAGDVEPQGREAGAVGVEVGGGLLSKEAETTARGDARLTQAVVLPQVIVASQKGETRFEGDPIQIEERGNLG